MITRYHDSLESALTDIEDVRGGIVYRRGAVHSHHSAEIARWDSFENRVMVGEGASKGEAKDISRQWPTEI